MFRPMLTCSSTHVEVIIYSEACVVLHGETVHRLLADVTG
jgi:hypothetical protein